MCRSTSLLRNIIAVKRNFQCKMHLTKKSKISYPSNHGLINNRQSLHSLRNAANRYMCPNALNKLLDIDGLYL